MTATVQEVDLSAATEAEDHLRWVFHGTEGYKVIGIYNRETGKMIERSHQWFRTYFPEVNTQIEAGAPIEVFYCPLPMSTPDRSIGNSAARWVVWADADKGLEPSVRDTLRRWGFRIVSSGTPGRFHVYARLSRAVTLAEHRSIQEGLAAFIGGDPAVKADNAFLRVPMSWNYKNLHRDPAKRNDQPYRAEIEEHGRRRIDADGLMRRLGQFIPAQASAKKLRVTVGPAGAHVPDNIPASIQRIMRQQLDGGSRFRAAYKAVCRVMEAGYTLAEVSGILADYEPGLDKFEERRGGWQAQIEHLWAKRMSENDGAKFSVLGSIEDGTATLVKPQPVETWTGSAVFWDRRPLFQHIYRYAKANRLSPWGLLGAILVRACVATEPGVVLPDDGSLNLFLALVGVTGQGKGRLLRHAAKSVELFTQIEPHSIGSGQGIPHLFKKRDRDGTMTTLATRVLFEIPEVDKFTALTKGGESILDSELRQVYSGEAIGGAYADPTKRLPIAAHTYRLGLVMGVQPDRAGPLFQSAGGGTPQRFLWMPAYDEVQPAERPRYKAQPWEWRKPEWAGEMGLPDEALDEIDQDLVRRNAAGFDAPALDSHSLFTRSKVAAIIALLDSRISVSSEDWTLAGVVMDVSDRERDKVLARINSMGKAEQVRAGRSAAIRQVATEQAVRRITEERRDQIQAKVVTVLEGSETGSMSLNELKKHSSLKRAAADLSEVLDGMVGDGQLRVRQGRGRQIKGTVFSLMS
ncbi:hypothetical protein [Actinoplanes auranticolor]|uniref:Uncharacterized protein n=1 Tax=Actinoplanes auranticolor TaxID=47988 RepID=A0A919SV34_9ACTN|nr:hypothetical protein [Actinoplanes auranticolor]GIM78051.1 hypothetical protein Aau02nite_79000 [Actinoplanes auranticolor]